MKGKKKTWRQDRRSLWKAQRPWVRLVEWARRRCNDTKSKWYPYYGAQGIKCLLTAKDLEPIWIRDKAHLLKRPSLDRIRSMDHYQVDNVRIIEFDVNSRLAWDPGFKFLYKGDPEA